MIDIRQKMREQPTFEDMGPIPNPEGFSAPCRQIFNKEAIDTPLSWSPNTGYDLSPIPAQFHPSILKAIDAHKKIDPENIQSTCCIHLNQGILQPQQTFRIKVPHFDALVESYPFAAYPNNDVYMVSDALPTVFYPHTVDMPAYIMAEEDMLNMALLDIFRDKVDPAHAVISKPHHMMRIDSYTLHCAQVPKVPTQRAFLMARFF